jgi:acyl dehydratase
MRFSAFTAGQKWQTAPIEITLEQIIEFARAWDPMPFHLDDDYAKSTRFGAIIASGHLTFLANWANFVRTHPQFIEGIIAGTQITERWHAPVYAGDRLRSTLTITGAEPRNAYNGVVCFRVEIFNQDDVLVLLADVEIIVEQ